MKYVKPLLSLCLSLGACGTPAGSKLSTFFGPHTFELLDVNTIDNVPNARAMGALYLMLLDDAGLSQSIVKYCTAIQVSPRFVLTNAHCLQRTSETAYAPFYFSKDYVALEGETGHAEAQDLAGKLYFLFTGKTRLEETRGLLPNLRVHTVGTDLDYALLEITNPGFDTKYIDLTQVETPLPGTPLNLLGYPNALPLMRSFACQSAEVTGHEMKHDCDSAGGASGGLLFSEQSGAPVALHRQGIFDNSFAFYKENGRSETVPELAARECSEKYKLETGTETWNECVKIRAEKYVTNRAIPLALILEDLANKGIELNPEKNTARSQ